MMTLTLFQGSVIVLRIFLMIGTTNEQLSQYIVIISFLISMLLMIYIFYKVIYLVEGPKNNQSGSPATNNNKSLKVRIDLVYKASFAFAVAALIVSIACVAIFCVILVMIVQMQ